MPKKTTNICECEKIVDHRTNSSGRREFLVKWKGFSPDHNTWEPERHILDKNLICVYAWKLKKILDKQREREEARARAVIVELELLGGEGQDGEKKDKDVFECEKVMKMRMRNEKKEYLLKWVGWPDRYNTWEPEENILDPMLIRNFERNLQRRMEHREKKLYKVPVHNELRK